MVVLLLQHKEVVKPVFVADAIEPEPLAVLLHNLFPSLKGQGEIVGIRHSRQTHFNNLALVCATLQNFKDRVYHIVTEDDKSVATDANSASSNAGLPLAIVSVGDTSESIDIFRSDVECLQRFYNATRLPSVSLAQLWDIFRGRVSNGAEYISKQVYFDCVDELLKADAARSPTWADKVESSRVFDAIFEAFDHDRSGHVGFNEFVSAFTCLVAGSKSDKLSFSFEIFDEAGTGLLTRSQLCHYLHAFLTMVGTLANLDKSDSKYNAAGAEDARLARSEACVDLVEEIFSGCPPPIDSGDDRDDDDLDGLIPGAAQATHISFEQFGRWYTTGGYNQALWLELIDGRKWPQIDTADDDDASGRNSFEDAAAEDGGHARAPSAGSAGTSVSSGGGGSAAGSKPPHAPLQFHLQNAKYTVTVDTRDGEDMHELATTTRLCDVSVADVFEVIQRHAMVANSSHNLSSFSPAAPFKMDKRGFNSTIQDLVPGELLTAAQQQSVSVVLNNVFSAFDRANTSVVGADELALGLSLFCRGSKSEKLFEAFRVFLARAQAAASSPGGTPSGPAGVAANEGLLTRRAVWVLLRSFLTAIMALTRDATTRPAKEIFSIIDREVVSLIASIFQFSSPATVEGSASKVLGLGFVDFGQWYNTIGFDRMQWIELLCLKSWPLPASYGGAAAKSPQSARNARAARRRSGISHQLATEDAIQASSPSAAASRSMQASADYVLMVALHTQKMATNIRFTQLDMRRLAALLRCIDRGMFQVDVLAEVFGSVGTWATQTDVLARLAHCVNLGTVSPTRASTDSSPRSTLSNSLRSPHSRTSPRSSPRNLAEPALDPDELEKQDAVDVMVVLSHLCASFAMEGTRDADENDMGSTAEQGVVRVKDFVVGLTMLGWGKKSEKLAAAFDFLDEFEMGSLSMTQFGRLLKAFLCVVFSLNGDLMTLPGDVREGLIDDAVAKITASAFLPQVGEDDAEEDDSDVSPRRQRRVSLSFKDFGTWYNGQTVNFAPWLQLLDLAKWPGVEEAATFASDDLGGVDAGNNVGPEVDYGEDVEPDINGEAEYPFVCSLLPPHRCTADYDGFGCALQLSADDFANMSTLQQLTAFGRLSAEQVVNIFAQEEDATPGRKRSASNAGSTVVVSLAKGKSAAASSSAGPQSVELAKQKREEAKEKQAQATAAATAQQNMPSTKKPATDKHDTPKFKKSGMNLEVDVKAKVSPSAPQPLSAGPPSRTPSRITSPKLPGSEGSLLARSLGAALGASPATVGADESKKDNSSAAVDTAPLVANKMDDDTKTMNEETYNALIREELVSDSGKLTPDQLSFLAAVFGRLFDAYDAEQDDTVARVKVASGLCLFAKGGRTDKLRHIFRAHDADRDDLLSRKELAAFLESLLLALVALSQHSSTHRDTDTDTGDESTARSPVRQAVRNRSRVQIAKTAAEVETLRQYQVVVHDYAEWVSREVFSFAHDVVGVDVYPGGETEDKDAEAGAFYRVSYEDFDRWFTDDHGHDVAPWLNLFDLKLWESVYETICNGDQRRTRGSDDDVDGGFSSSNSSSSSTTTTSDSDSSSDDESDDGDDSHSSTTSTSGDYDRLAMDGVTTDEDDLDSSGDYSLGDDGDDNADIEDELRSRLQTGGAAGATLNADTPVGAYEYHQSRHERAAADPSVATYFDLNIDGSGPPMRLQFTVGAIRRIRLFVACAPGLASIESPQEVVERFEAVATPAFGTRTGSGYVVTRMAYDVIVRSLCFNQGGEVAEGERYFVAHMAGILFRYFAVENGEGGELAAPFPEIALAFSVFAPVKKSAKLGLSFDLLGVSNASEDADKNDDDDRDIAEMGTWEFARFFDTFLRLFYALATEAEDEEGDTQVDRELSVQVAQIRHTAEYLGVLVVERITGNVGGADTDTDTDATGGGMVSFVSFANWYTLEGHSDFSWLELLYLPKLFHFDHAELSYTKDTATATAPQPPHSSASHPTMSEDAIRGTLQQRRGMMMLRQRSVEGRKDSPGMIPSLQRTRSRSRSRDTDSSMAAVGLHGRARGGYPLRGTRQSDELHATYDDEDEADVTDSADELYSDHLASGSGAFDAAADAGEAQYAEDSPMVVIALDALQETELHLLRQDLEFGVQLLRIGESRGGSLSRPDGIAHAFSNSPDYSDSEDEEEDDEEDSDDSLGARAEARLEAKLRRDWAGVDKMYDRQAFNARVLAMVGGDAARDKAGVGRYSPVECDALSRFFVGCFARLSALFLAVSAYRTENVQKSRNKRRVVGGSVVSPTFQLLHGLGLSEKHRGDADDDGRDEFSDEDDGYGDVEDGAHAISVPARACACGLSILGNGSKSVKLALAFRLWDRDGVGAVSRFELFSLLASFLAVVASLGAVYVAEDDPILQEFDLDNEEVREAYAEDGEDAHRARSPTGGALLHTHDVVPIAEALRRSLAATVLRVFEDLEKEPDARSRVSFEEFAGWYSDGGFTRIRWLELLDFRKWQGVLNDAPPPPLRRDYDNDGDFDADDGLDDMEGEEPEMTEEHVDLIATVTGLSKNVLEMMTQAELRQFWNQVGKHVTRQLELEGSVSFDGEEMPSDDGSGQDYGDEEDEISSDDRLSPSDYGRYRQGVRVQTSDEDSSSSSSSSSSSDGSDAEDANDDGFCYFALSTGDEESHTLQFGREDVQFLDWLCTNTQLPALDPRQLCDVLSTSATPASSPSTTHTRTNRAAAAAAYRSGSVREVMAHAAQRNAVPATTLSWGGFKECMGAVLMEFMSEELEVAFESLFDHFHYYADGTEGNGEDGGAEVDLKVFSAGFSILAGGRKSGKIAAGFKLFDSDGDAALTGPQFTLLIKAYIIVLLALGQHNDVHRDVPESAARYVCDRVFAESPASQARGLISHAAFGEWYNSVGHEVIPWLELLDLRKWEYIPQSTQENEDAEEEEEEEEEDDDDGYEDEDDVEEEVDVRPSESGDEDSDGLAQELDGGEFVWDRMRKERALQEQEQEQEDRRRHGLGQGQGQQRQRPRLRIRLRRQQ